MIWKITENKPHFLVSFSHSLSLLTNLHFFNLAVVAILLPVSLGCLLVLLQVYFRWHFDIFTMFATCSRKIIQYRTEHVIHSALLHSSKFIEEHENVVACGLIIPHHPRSFDGWTIRNESFLRDREKQSPVLLDQHVPEVGHRTLTEQRAYLRAESYQLCRTAKFDRKAIFLAITAGCRLSSDCVGFGLVQKPNLPSNWAEGEAEGCLVRWTPFFHLYRHLKIYLFIYLKRVPYYCLLSDREVELLNINIPANNALRRKFIG